MTTATEARALANELDSREPGAAIPAAAADALRSLANQMDLEAKRERLREALVNLLARLPKDLPAVHWGATVEKTDDNHVADLANSLARTRAHFNTGIAARMHGVYFDSNPEFVFCITGTSPNSPQRAQDIVALWNWVREAAAAFQKPEKV